jgi:hypothetical protein
MTAYSRLQEKEFSREFSHGYEAVKHQKFVGTGYFDAITEVVTQGMASTKALEGSTETEQFAEMKKPGFVEIGHDPACRPILGECPMAADEHPSNMTQD